MVASKTFLEMTVRSVILSQQSNVKKVRWTFVVLAIVLLSELIAEFLL